MLQKYVDIHFVVSDINLLWGGGIHVELTNHEPIVNIYTLSPL